MKFKIFKTSVSVVDAISPNFQNSINDFLAEMEKLNYELIDKTVHTLNGTLVITLWHNKRPDKYMKIFEQPTTH